MPATYRGGDPTPSIGTIAGHRPSRQRVDASHGWRHGRPRTDLGWAACPTIWRPRRGAIFRRLRQLGVDIVLVNSGTDFPPIIEGLAEAETHEVDLQASIVVPHEHVAMGIAHGYYVASGRAQAVMLHTNVGLANGAIGAINMATDHVPVVLMSGRTPTVERGRFGARTVPIGWGQEMRNQATLVREASRWSTRCASRNRCPSCSTGTWIAMSTPKGPVYLSLRAGAVRAVPGRRARERIAMRAASIMATPDQLAEGPRCSPAPSAH